MSCKDLQEIVTAFVDNQVSQQERALLSQHLEECRACTSALAQERQMKVRMREAGLRLEAPAELRATLQRKYGSQRDGLWAHLSSWRQMRVWPVPAVVLLVVLVLLSLAFLEIGSKPGISVEMVQMHRAVDAGAVDYPKGESPELVARELSRAVGDRFMPPVYDLAKFGFHAAGGFRHKVGDRDVLVTVYKGSKQTLTCHAFLGDEEDIPEGAQLVYDPVDGKKFFTFSEGAINSVLQQYGDEICVLVSRLPMDELIRIARSIHHVNHGRVDPGYQGSL